MITFTIYGDPKPQARARMTKSGHVYTPQNSADYRARVRNAAAEAMQGRELIKGPAAVFVQIVKQSKTTGWKKGEREWLDNGGLMALSKKPDCDNVLKQVFDACNGVVWVDDAQVMFAPPLKLHGREPRVRVWIWTPAKLFWTDESVEQLVNTMQQEMR